MANSNETTPRERLARILTLLRRTRMYWRSTLAIATAGILLSLVFAWHSKRAWRSETTILYREAMQAQRDTENMTQKAARLGPKLKDMITARPRLTQIVQEFDLYPEKQRKSMLHAVEELAENVSFKSRASDTFVISFVHHDPVVAQKVAARLAELMIGDYSRETLGTATMTRDFLKRELEETHKQVEASSRSLAQFLADHPQFQWGLNDSPYAPTQAAIPGMPGVMVGVPGTRPAPPRAAPRSADPQMAALEAKLARIDGELTPPRPAAAPADPAAAAGVADAQKQRDAAAAALQAAQTALQERLLVVTPAHPDALSGKARVDSAQKNLAAAEANLRAARPGAPAAAPTGDHLPPQRKADLEKERRATLTQIAQRRSQLAASAGSVAPPQPQAAASGAPAAEGAVVVPPKATAPTTVELETEWHRLKLDLDRARENLKTVQANERAADIAAAAAEKKTQAEMMVLDPAYLPTKPDRGKGRVFLFGSIMALFLALGIAGARTLLNDTLYDPGDVLAAGAPPVLVSFPTVPHRDLVPRSIVPSSGPDEMARPYQGGPQSNRPSVRPAAATPLRPVPPPHDPWREAATASPESGRTREGVRTLMMPYGAPEARPAARRSPTATLRFGTPMDADAFGASSTALAPVRHTSSGAALALVHPLPMVEAVVDEPEIEVVGADVSEGHGVQSLLRGAPANAIAALRVLRHRLDQRRGDDGHFVVSVLSAGAGEGKTTLAIRLALILSEAERARVVLVEANLERPRLARVLGLHIPEDIGLSAQIRRRMAGGSRPWGVIKLAPSLNVLVEPGEEAAFPGALHSTHFDAVLRTLQRNYDYVIIDGPAVLGSGDGNVVEDVSDGVVVVAQAGRTQGTALCRTADQLGDRRIVGVVLNAGPPKGRRSRKARSA